MTARLFKDGYGLYRHGGLTLMLEEHKSSGRPSVIPDWAVQRLTEELSDPEGFSSYGEVQVWLEAELGIKAKYDVIHNLVHDKLQASLKIARGKSQEQELQAIETFKKKLPERLKVVVNKLKGGGENLQRFATGVKAKPV